MSKQPTSAYITGSNEDLQALRPYLVEQGFVDDKAWNDSKNMAIHNAMVIGGMNDEEKTGPFLEFSIYSLDNANDTRHIYTLQPGEDLKEAAERIKRAFYGEEQEANKEQGGLPKEVINVIENYKVEYKNIPTDIRVLHELCKYDQLVGAKIAQSHYEPIIAAKDAKMVEKDAEISDLKAKNNKLMELLKEYVKADYDFMSEQMTAAQVASPSFKWFWWNYCKTKGLNEGE